MLATAATPVQAGPNAVVVLEVELQAGGAFLQWQLVDPGAGPPPTIDGWLISKSIDGGTPVVIALAATETAYADPDVEPGHLYAYTVTFTAGADDGPQSNPVFLTEDCPLIILRCFPFDFLPFPSVKTECLCL